MKIRLLGLLAALITTVAGAQVYSIFSPGPSGPVKSNGSFALQTEVAADIIGLWSGTCSASTFLSGSGACANPVAGSINQIQYNSGSSTFAASSLMTFTPASVVLNLGASTTPGTFSVGTLDTMVINGVTVPIPGFAINSNIQGVIENHSYQSGPGTGGSRYYGVRSRGTISAPTIVATGDHLSNFYAAGYNGSTYSLGGYIRFQVDGTPGATAMPSDLDFAVSPAGSQTPTSRLTLMNDGSYAVSGAVGSAGSFLRSAGAGVATGWSAVTLPNADLLGDIWYASGANTMGVLPGNITTQKLFLVQTGSGATSNAPTWNSIVASDLPGSFSGFANSSASVGLAAVNGVATTAARSDSAPALSQAIAPTWTATHIFNGAYSTATTPSNVSPGQNGITFTNAAGAANAKIWDILQTNANHLTFRAVNDAFSTADNWMDVTRSAGAITAISLGNSTDLPATTINANQIQQTGNANLVQFSVSAAPNQNAQLTMSSSSSSGTLCVSSSTTCFNNTQTIGAGVLGLIGSSGEWFGTGGGGVQMTIGNNVVTMPKLASSSAATTGTMCWTTGTGNITIDTTTTCLASSIRFKQDVKNLDVGLHEVMKFRPVSYQLKPQYDPSHLGRQEGLIAEEVQKIDPRLVSLDKDGKTPRGVRYQQLTAVLIKAIQEQQAEIQELKAELKKVKH